MVVIVDIVRQKDAEKKMFLHYKEEISDHFFIL
jgi:hypothetical protein